MRSYPIFTLSTYRTFWTTFTCRTSRTLNTLDSLRTFSTGRTLFALSYYLSIYVAYHPVLSYRINMRSYPIFTIIPFSTVLPTFTCRTSLSRNTLRTSLTVFTLRTLSFNLSICFTNEPVTCLTVDMRSYPIFTRLTVFPFKTSWTLRTNRSGWTNRALRTRYSSSSSFYINCGSRRTLRTNRTLSANTGIFITDEPTT